MKVKLPRKVRGYKISDKDYQRALKRADKLDKVPLATQIEEWVTRYGKEGEPMEKIIYIENI